MVISDNLSSNATLVMTPPAFLSTHGSAHEKGDQCQGLVARFDQASSDFVNDELTLEGTSRHLEGSPIPAGCFHVLYFKLLIMPQKASACLATVFSGP